jgi:hypothetical protein
MCSYSNLIEQPIVFLDFSQNLALQPEIKVGYLNYNK